MKLNQAIIHELIKERKQKDTPNTPPQVTHGKLLDIKDEAVVTLVNSVLTTYGTKGNSSAQGTFDKDGAYTFPEVVDNFLDNKTSFELLSKSTMENLKESSKSRNLATGGYLVFGLYDFDVAGTAAQMILIAMVKKRSGIVLTNLVPKTIQEVNLSQLYQAVKINLSRYSAFLKQEAEDNTINSYLSFISPKANSDASGYFIEAIGCTDAVPDKDATNGAIAAVGAFFEKEPKLVEMKRAAKEKIARNLFEKSQSDDPSCSLDTIDAWVTAMLPEEFQEKLGNKFTEFANDEPYNVPTTFRSNAGAAKKAMRLSLDSKSDGWNMNFDRALLGSTKSATIQYDKNNKQIIIRELSERIIKHIEDAIESK